MNKGCLISIGTLLVILTAGLVYYFISQNSSGPERLEVTKPEIIDIYNKAVATGSIIPRLEINIKPQVSGVVDKQYVKAGEMIEKGQKIARIKLIPSEINVNNAQSNVNIAKIMVEEARRELERQTLIFNEKLDLDQYVRNLEVAVQDEVRQQSLLDQGIISKQEYQQTLLDRDIKQNAYDNAVLQSKNSLGQFETQLDVKKQELETSINNLSLLKKGASNGLRQTSNIVTSTVTGMVLDIPVEIGGSVIERNNFNEGTSIATIADMEIVVFEGKVDESEVGKLKEGMNLLLTIGAIPNKKFKAILEFISPKGFETEGTVKFEVRAAIQPYDTSIVLRAGYSANADIIIDQREKVLAIQERDVIYDNDMAFTDVVTANEEITRKPIELGLSDGLYVQVIQGIDSSTTVKKQIDPRSNNN